MKTTHTLASLLLSASLAHAAPEVGNPAPDFTVRDASGTEQTLSKFAGKTVVLEWYNYGCPFVEKHYDSKNMQDLQKEATGDGVVWLTIVSSAPGKQGHLTPAEAQEMKTQTGSNATAILLDEDGAIGKLYGAKTTPEMFVINPAGALIYAGAIDDQPTPDPASLNGAMNYVSAALKEAKSGGPVTVAKTQPYGCSVKY